ncbi:MAG: SPFH domain-containing protein [Deltaproteobacteria bacterium]|nr:SPFH domain-containing protein [Deltaproteobacteria bacterium]
MALIDILEFQDQTREVMAKRLPDDLQADIKMGAQLIVREAQVAIFYRGGQALDTFGPGRHTLTTANLPILSQLINLPFGGNTPFKAEVVFVDTGLIDDQKWGTKEPISFRDTVLKVVRLRSFGTMTYKIVDPVLFTNKRLKSSSKYTSSDFANWARDSVVQRMTDVLGEVMKSIFDLPALYDEIVVACKARLSEDFAKNGIELEDLRINAISPPKEVQEKIDERSGMGLFEDSMPAFQQYQMGYALRDAAKNEGGTAGAGMGMGMGLGMGFMMPGVMAQGMAPGMPQQGGMPPQGYPPQGYQQGMPPQGYPPQGYQQGMPPQGYPPQGYQQGMPPQGYPPQGTAAVGAAAPPSSPQGFACSSCGYGLGPGQKFCPNCGKPQAEPDKVPCVKCQSPLPAGSKFCPNCGSSQVQNAPQNLCVNCQKELAPGARFCPYCGTPQPA